MLIWMLGVVVMLGGGLWLAQRRLIYLPSGGVPPIGEVFAGGWEEVTLTTSDNLDLAAWYHPPPDQAPVVIVFNGNAGNRAGRAPLGRALAAEGFGVLLSDYRGYGGNPGRPTEAGLALDARAAVAYVQAHAAGHPLVLFGESLGAAVAVEVATAHSPAALVLRSPFTSLADAASVHYPLLPVDLFLWDEFDSASRVGSIQVPTLVIAGSEDSIVPLEQSRLLYELAAGPKEFAVIEGADHNDMALLAGARLVDVAGRFVWEVAR